MYRVDLNSDLGESFGAYTIGNDQEILKHVTSANIACGFHAGDPVVIKKTIDMALARHTAIGAHPGLPDLVGFGRRKMAVSPDEVYAMVLYQTGALQVMAHAVGASLQHVKPHGALYNMAAVDAALADAIAEAVYHISPEIILFGLAGSELIRAGEKRGLRTASEVFADRTYQPDGTLTPRSQPNAMITDEEEAIQQVVRMIREGIVIAADGSRVPVKADTVCIHGDGAAALAFAKKIHETLDEENVEVSSFQ